MTATGRRGRAGGDEAAAAGLTGAGPSQLGVDGSMRARDVSRPAASHLADAERIVQVSYRPRPKVTAPEASRAAHTPSAERSGEHDEAPS